MSLCAGCSSREEIKALQKELASAEKLLALPSLSGIDGGRKVQMRVESLKERIRSAAQAQAAAGARPSPGSPLPLAAPGNENSFAAALPKGNDGSWQGSAKQRLQPLLSVGNVEAATWMQRKQGSTGPQPEGDHIDLRDD